MKIFPPENGFYKLLKPPVRVVEWLKYSVDNVYRFYEDGWHVHEEHLLDIVRLALKSGHVDWSLLSVDKQMEIARAKTEWRMNPGRETTFSSGKNPDIRQVADDFATLHLLPSAPDVIIESAFKALAKIHHPDKGGDEEVFKRISAAYTRLRSR